MSAICVVQSCGALSSNRFDEFIHGDICSTDQTPQSASRYLFVIGNRECGGFTVLVMMM